MEESKNDPILIALILSLLFLLSYAGFLAYKSIQWNVLDVLEAQPLILPTPIVSSPISTQSSSPKE